MSRNIVRIVQFLLLISIFKETLSDEFRLPKHVVPKNYNLKIIPNFDGISYDYYNGEIKNNFELEGTVIIQMNCLIGGSKNITLNAIGINVTSYNLTDDKGNNISVQSLDVVEDKHFLVFNLTETLNVTSNYSLFLKYQSSEYISSGYTSSDNLYFTSLPLINARNIFPCFDEPEFKATFDLTLARKPTMNTLSNMPHKNISTTKSDELQTNNTFSTTSYGNIDTKKPTDTDLVYDEFQTTPNMSTHVLGFYISTFSSQNATNTSNVDIKMWAPDNSRFVGDNEILQKAVEIYEGLQQYLNSTQPIKKQDLVYTKHYTHEGADSWGLINFAREEMYIGNKSLSYSNEKNLISLAHKLSHQWLGNLVTPSWWSDLWVSEGTSTFMSYFVLEGKINKIWDKFIYSIFQAMLIDDSLNSSIPLKHEVTGDLLEISLFFDSLSGKGACITRMMMKTFGDKVFKKGIQYFLKEFSFRNVEEDDLWSSLQKSVNNTNISVKDIMSSWTTQSGYPLVTVNVSEMCRYIVISQEQFFDRKKNDTGKLWAIPLKYQVIYIDNQTVVNRELIHIGKNATTKINDSLIMNNTLVIANYELLGFFRVNYDMNNWDKIIKQLLNNHTIIDVLNRAQFMDDAFSLVGPSIENYTLGMRISQYLVNETQELPWLTFFKHLGDFYNDIILNNVNSEFMKYLKNITRNIFRPWNETELESEVLGLSFDLNMAAANWACLSGNEECNTWAINAFDRWRNVTEEGVEITRKIYHEGRFLKTIACSKLRNNTDNATLEFVLRQMFRNYALQSTISCVDKEDQIHLILNEFQNVYRTLPSLSLSSIGRQVIREELRNMTYRGKPLDRDKIYSFLTLNLKKSLNETEFNQTESVFESIVSWPQVNTTIIDPKFNLSAIKNHTAKIRLTWLDNKKMEEEVIRVVK